ncbi:glycerol dehydratase [Vallitalea longa]|uniref:Glycerol dehydratase n=1 Tax=Vallitalea longa TaxID=2936439 RepID=A0A9W6DDH5_9FIRM|nr:glycerol dehydratase reactivase beta/small subunit family protein [Vallitalea longa]GKX28170.1 glycerol dehydratase [Vallitalea longa]
MENRRPEIHVCYSKQNKRYVKDILAGIEEEGLFSYCYETREFDPIVTAYRAAESSLLGVGVSAVGNHVVLHVSNLKSDEPLLKMNITDLSDYRGLGSNAARYVKGIPFRL